MSAVIRPFAFEATSAVSASRAHTRFVRCPACQADTPRHLFHRAGVRFVRCAGCGAVYVNPAREHPVNDLDIERVRPFTNARDRALMNDDFDRLLARLEDDHARLAGAPLTRTLLLGRFLRGWTELPRARQVGLDVAELTDDAFARLVASDLGWARPLLERAPQVVILHELLEACPNPGAVLATLTAALPPSTIFAVTYTNADSLPARMMRRHWPSFFDYKQAYLSTGNLTALMARYGLVLKNQYPLPVTRTAQYIADFGTRMAPGTAGIDRVVRATPLRDVAVPVRAGNRVAIFGRSALAAGRGEKLSIVLPVFNEARYAAQVIDAVLAKPLRIEKEVIIVESNSTDGTREIVAGYEGRPGVRVVYEDRPQGKGHAVRTGLAHVSGTIVLIQDADFEYDIDDYDALLEPLLQHQAMFVLGSRSLGLDDWKVRRYDRTPVRGLALNFAQVVFAKTYNLLYQQHVTNVNTMFKVFRAECLDGSISQQRLRARHRAGLQAGPQRQLADGDPGQLRRAGVRRGEEIRFWRDAIPSYAAFFRHRFM